MTSRNYFIAPGLEPIKENHKMIIDFICYKNGITRFDLMSKSRKRKVVDAKHLCSYFLYNKLSSKPNLQTVAEMVGLTSHCTVIHSLSKVKQLIEVDTNFKKKYDEINEIFIN